MADKKEITIKIDGPPMAGKTHLVRLLIPFLEKEGYEVKHAYLDDRKNKNREVLIIEFK